MDSLLRYGETGAALLQGKGAGSGWNLQSEIDAAAACIKRPEPLLLDVGANYGQWAEGMLQAFPAAKRVILCEPQERCLITLQSECSREGDCALRYQRSNGYRHFLRWARRVGRGIPLRTQ